MFAPKTIRQKVELHFLQVVTQFSSEIEKLSAFVDLLTFSTSFKVWDLELNRKFVTQETLPTNETKKKPYNCSEVES